MTPKSHTARDVRGQSEAPDRPLVDVRDLTTHFWTARGTVPAVDGVSFSLRHGEILGVVGESGSGKTMLTRSIVGLHAATNIARYDGHVSLAGTDLMTVPPDELRRTWGRHVGMVFQDPSSSLNPVVRIGRQITEGLRLNLGLSASKAEQRATELLRVVGIADPRRRLRDYPHQLSGGQRQRVAIAIAIACEPDLLIADEPTTGLDVTVQAQILDLLGRLRDQRRMAIIMVTHDLGVVAGFADRIAVMYAGQLVEIAPTDLFFANPRSPYGEALLASSPKVDGGTDERLPVIPGRPPDLANLGPGCRFRPRCRYAEQRCASEPPPLTYDVEDGRAYRCWYPLDGSDPA